MVATGAIAAAGPRRDRRTRTRSHDWTRSARGSDRRQRRADRPLEPARRRDAARGSRPGLAASHRRAQAERLALAVAAGHRRRRDLRDSCSRPRPVPVDVRTATRPSSRATRRVPGGRPHDARPDRAPPTSSGILAQSFNDDGRPGSPSARRSARPSGRTSTRRPRRQRVLAEGEILAGDEADVTIMFVDIVGFSARAELMPAELVCNGAQRVLRARGPRSSRTTAGTPTSSSATDCIAVFGTPLRLDDHADRARATPRARSSGRLAGPLPRSAPGWASVSTRGSVVGRDDGRRIASSTSRSSATRSTSRRASRRSRAGQATSSSSPKRRQ